MHHNTLIMALETKIEFLGTDLTGRILNIKDVSTGWGDVSKSSIDRIFITLSKYNDNKIYKATWYRDPDPNKPEQLSNPSVEDILNGETLGLNSYQFGVTTLEQGLVPFNDGVYDINAYYIQEDSSDILVGTKGDIFLQGDDTDDIVNLYDSIIISGDIYEIDKTKPTNGGTLLYVDRPLKEDTDVVALSFRSQVYALNISESSCALKTLVGKYTGACGCSSDCTDKYLKLLEDITASNIAFCQGDYHKSHILAECACERAKSCGCGCI